MKSVNWLVLASSTQSLIYEVDKREYKLVKNMTHEDSRLKAVDLVSDKEGNYMSGNTGHGKYQPATDSHQREHQRFAQEVAAYLDKGRVDHQYNGLIICAEPHFYGLIEGSIPKTVQSLVKKAIHKDYIPLPEAQRNQVIEGIIEENRY